MDRSSKPASPAKLSIETPSPSCFSNKPLIIGGATIDAAAAVRKSRRLNLAIATSFLVARAPEGAAVMDQSERATASIDHGLQASGLAACRRIQFKLTLGSLRDCDVLTEENKYNSHIHPRSAESMSRLAIKERGPSATLAWVGRVDRFR